MDPSMFSLEKKNLQNKVVFFQSKQPGAPFGFQVHKERDRLEKPVPVFSASKGVETWYQRNHDDFQVGDHLFKRRTNHFLLIVC